MDDFTGVYKKYVKVSESDSGDATTSYLDVMGRPCTSSHNIIVSDKSSELARYLNETKVPSVEEFDILAWWRAYTPIFPTLARMARDFLALPIHVDECYIHMELNQNRTLNTAHYIIYDEDLDGDIKPALMCLTQWL
ncbi:zinc finger BED domain-containing protein RICESLEEPER 2-like [Melia azedarach]|uniref:Zinc finger BED domain-containing protein RICESLEEPER 2-like n=2 Tax=Melia azedarach TaxID=155640 RepID=A0ACC1YJB8_MELAZ|nr:zinc finger BED domain-containing protein RICESLEEPER 2-like [Melia azedarach]KAJ4723590.1 zinc finger BED domain-containing protein RICESLEEPER 2-like [Melia azedarach]